jgi:hypothetical protein
MKHKLLLPILFTLAATPAIAQNTGRYQGVALPKAPNETGDHMMILDTVTGDLWQWSEAPAIGNSAGGESMTYMGRPDPGQPGETKTFKKIIQN